MACTLSDKIVFDAVRDSLKDSPAAPAIHPIPNCSGRQMSQHSVHSNSAYCIDMPAVRRASVRRKRAPLDRLALRLARVSSGALTDIDDNAAWRF